ncbi:hypothetical protein [Hyalangium rubrum]|uniref:Uncharacterized protein n=1 Tax=Hyalangium rubrum TaxID=3103134 RepID=A0ABU5HKA5_9BACT|nr:hypothetical protein [Hyalangium sp. s54d21]MDY7233278.1 hypothetical protein [Hyalangium sp. s54d21]
MAEFGASDPASPDITFLRAYKNLLDAPNGVSAKVREAVSEKRRARANRAIKRARLAGCEPTIEQTIWRAATYTAEDLDAVTANLPQCLRVPLSKLLQRNPSERYQTAGELEADLRRWLGDSFRRGAAATELNELKKAAGKAMVDVEPDAMTS